MENRKWKNYRFLLKKSLDSALPRASGAVHGRAGRLLFCHPELVEDLIVGRASGAALCRR
jgi:hypothetical protein